MNNITEIKIRKLRNNIFYLYGKMDALLGDANSNNEHYIRGYAEEIDQQESITHHTDRKETTT